MNLNELLELVRAGYSKEDIQALTQPEAEPEKPEPEKEPEPEPKEPAPAAGPDHFSFENELKDIRASIAEMVKTFQAANVQNARMGEPKINDSAEDILAEWLNPKAKEK